MIPIRAGVALVASALALGLVAAATPTASASLPPIADPAHSPRQVTAAKADTRGLFGATDPTYDGVYRQSAAILGLAAVGAQVPPSAVAWLLRQQCSDGSFAAYRADTAGPCPPSDATTFTGPDSNSTAIAAMALLRAGDDVPRRADRLRAGAAALRWLKNQQGTGGGWVWIRGLAADSVSTAMAAAAVAKTSRASHDRAMQWLRRHMNAAQQCALRFQGGTLADPLSTAWAFISTQGPLPYQPLTGERKGVRRCTGSAPVTASATWLADQLISGGGQIPSTFDPDATDWNSTALATLGMTQKRGSGPAMRAGLRALQRNVDAYVDTPAGDSAAALGTLLMVAHAGRIAPRDFGGHDLVARLLVTMRR